MKKRGASPMGRVEATEDFEAPFGAALDTSMPWPSIPDTGFSIVRTLGAGNMGVVLLVERNKKHYAMKIVRRDIGRVSENRSNETFLRKAEILATIDHPNVIGVVEYGISGGDDGVPYMVMEFVPGHPLNQLPGKEKKDIGWKLSVLRQVAMALDALHAKGLVHRDVKPGNILVVEDGTAKLGDFGIAGVMDAENGSVLGAFGSPAYMAPEAFDPDKPKDARSDIFSLGVVAYELFTGVKPFAGTTVAAVKRSIQRTNPIVPWELEPSLPAHIADLLAGMLEKSPERRIDSAAEVARRLSAEPRASRKRAGGGSRRVWRGMGRAS